MDFLPSTTTSLDPYRLIVIPGLFAFGSNLKKALELYSGMVLMGPRSGSKTADFAIPDGLPPNLDGLLDIQVQRVETLRCDCPVKAGDGNFQYWREFVAAGKNASVTRHTDDGHPAMIRQNNFLYVCGWPDELFLDEIYSDIFDDLKIRTIELPEGLRLVSCGSRNFRLQLQRRKPRSMPICSNRKYSSAIR